MKKINITILTGRLTKDIELKGSDDKKFCRFNLAVDNPYKKDDASFVSCVAFKKTAELLAQYCAKGSKIGVHGYIKTGSYEKDGVKSFTTDVMVEKIEFLDSKKDTGDSSKNAPERAIDNSDSYDEDSEFPF